CSTRRDSSRGRTRARGAEAARVKRPRERTAGRSPSGTPGKGMDMRALRVSIVAPLAVAALVSIRGQSVLAQPRQAEAFAEQPSAAPLGVGEYTSLAVDGTGRTQVAWFDATRHALAYAIQTPSGWRSEIVDQDGRVGWYASLALDAR